MKKLKLIIIIWIISFTSKADVIIPLNINTPFTGFGTAVSLELIGSYELSFTKSNTINFWGGFGAVSIVDKFKYPSFGAELAIELKNNKS